MAAEADALAADARKRGEAVSTTEGMVNERRRCWARKCQHGGGKSWPGRSRETLHVGRHGPIDLQVDK